MFTLFLLFSFAAMVNSTSINVVDGDSLLLMFKSTFNSLFENLDEITKFSPEIRDDYDWLGGVPELQAVLYPSILTSWSGGDPCFTSTNATLTLDETGDAVVSMVFSDLATKEVLVLVVTL